MAKNKEGVNELVHQLALVSDSIEKIYPSAKKIIVFELNKKDFMDAKIQFNNLDRNVKKFNVDISGIEMVFIEDESLTS